MYNILIVDDEKIERNGIIFLLKKLGFELNVSEAANGKAALEYMMDLRENGGAIDILLTDVKMPFMDGIELIRCVV
ncbi:MAG: response regulator, partial [Eubacteriales bacterium]|nr:response regulator [Eubacteriales bacterium]